MIADLATIDGPVISSPAGYGTVLDSLATSESAPEFAKARASGLKLVYYLCPSRNIKRQVDIISMASQAYKNAQKTGQPCLLVNRGDRTPLIFRWPCETEVATVAVWPSGQVWAAKAIVTGRRVNLHNSFVASTSLNLPVDDRRVSRIREEQARTVALAVIAATSGLPYFPTLMQKDTSNRTALHVAAQAGLLSSLSRWTNPSDLTSVDKEGFSPALLAAWHGPIRPWVPHLTANSLRVRGAHRQTLVHLAAERGKLQTIAPLLSPGMLMTQDDQGNTPVHIAASNGGLNEVAHLLQPNLLTIKNRQGQTPVDLLGSNCPRVK